MDELELRVTCQAAPTQIEGKVNDRFIYFRERGGHWSFGIGDSIEEAVTEPIAEGECAEFMTVEDALALTKILVAVSNI